MQVAVFGDVGGHLPQFLRGLASLGVQFDPVFIPEDLIIIQVGDLIHKGPYSNQAIELSELFLSSDVSSQWIQLFGNHELQHVDAGPVFWKGCDCAESTLAILRRWWAEGVAHTAAGLVGGQHNKGLATEETVITHSGLTYPFANFVLEDMSARGIVAKLNAMQVQGSKLLGRAGAHLYGGAGDPFVGPFWGLGTQEVYSTWTTDYSPFLIPRYSPDGVELFRGGMPFNQIHGHSTAFLWDRRMWRATTDKYFRRLMNAYQDSRYTRYRPDALSGSFLGVDPGFEADAPRIDVQPHLFIEGVKEVFVG